MPKLLERVREIKCTGKVTIEEGSDFGMIILNDEWQKLQEELLEVLRSEKAACREEFISQASAKANDWGNLIGLVQKHSGFFTPTNSVGLHISLGKINKEEKPDCVVEGKEVCFSIQGFSTMPVMWALPQIVPSQKTTTVGDITLMNCPTRWYFITVEMKNFDFLFKYPPHVTVGCYGLMSVPEVAVKEMHKSLQESGYGSGEYEYGKT